MNTAEVVPPQTNPDSSNPEVIGGAVQVIGESGTVYLSQKVIDSEGTAHDQIIGEAE
jgi:hypothetical protein